MRNEVDVSVIVASYHPNILKMFRTLSSIVMQKDVSFELIVTDDGSDEDHFCEIEAFLKKKGFCKYQLLKNKQNVGTVRNIINAVQIARGCYVFLTSPGDLLHDNMVLYDFNAYAKANNAKIVFGDSVLYRVSGSDSYSELVDREERPYWPKLFNSPVSFYQQASFCFGNYIIGASFFRERNCFLKYLNEILPFCKYTEDNTTTALALADYIRIYYYPRKIVFYELGDGVTSSGSSKWRALIRDDFKNAVKHLIELHPKNKAFKALLYLYMNENASFATLKRTILYPTVSMVQICNKLRTKHRLSYDEKDKKQLDILLSVKEEI